MTAPELCVGDRIEVEVGPVAHGGHCVARHHGRVIFVRHAIPGERVRIEITEGHEGSRFLRADAVAILSASADRVEPPCPYARPGACGGCDFQHVTLQRQRALLGQVVTEQLKRLAGIDWPVEVEAVPGDVDGLRWRTRMRYTATADGRAGLRKHRSHELIAIDDCRIASAALPSVDRALTGGTAEAEAVVTATQEQVVIADKGSGPLVTEEAAGRRWRLHASDFWQVHPGAADTLVAAVVDGLDPAPGERCWDLYSGVGLFSASLAAGVGERGSVVAVESRRCAVDHARSNLAEYPQVRCEGERVERFVRSRIAQGRLDIVVLDPPRRGAGAEVVRSIARQQPRAIAYVACDPAALARDLATLRRCGYRLESLRAFDIFPMTHHVECVAIVKRTTGEVS